MNDETTKNEREKQKKIRRPEQNKSEILRDIRFITKQITKNFKVVRPYFRTSFPNHHPAFASSY